MKGLWSLNGLLGYGVIVVVLLGIVAFFWYKAVEIQTAQATHYYQIDAPKIRMFSAQNGQFYQDNAPKER